MKATTVHSAVKWGLGTVGETSLAIVLACAPSTYARADEATDLSSAAGVTLSGDLSPWSMFLNADILVQGVMILLAAASALTWTISLAKSVELWIGARRLARQTRCAEMCSIFEEIVAALNNRGGLEDAAVAARAEIAASPRLEGGGVKDRIASRLVRLEARAARRFRRATGALATIGATAPFVGLFGTVWGVMNSFVGIAKHHTTNLAVIAPGLAEALLTTALGLATAIPAVIFYNMLARGTATARGLYADGAEVILRLASRDIEQKRSNFPPPTHAAVE